MFKKGILLSTALSMAISFTSLEAMEAEYTGLVIGLVGPLVFGGAKILWDEAFKKEQKENQPDFREFQYDESKKNEIFTIGLSTKSQEAKKLLHIVMKYFEFKKLSTDDKEILELLSKVPAAKELYSAISHLLHDLAPQFVDLQHCKYRSNKDRVFKICEDNVNRNICYLTIHASIWHINTMENCKKFANKIEKDFEIFELFYGADGEKASRIFNTRNQKFDKLKERIQKF